VFRDWKRGYRTKEGRKGPKGGHFTASFLLINDNDWRRSLLSGNE
jgi:hypothetical protein